MDLYRNEFRYYKTITSLRLLRLSEEIIFAEISGVATDIFYNHGLKSVGQKVKRRIKRRSLGAYVSSVKNEGSHKRQY
jgi:hypothetical protein